MLISDQRTSCLCNSYNQRVKFEVFYNLQTMTFPEMYTFVCLSCLYEYFSHERVSKGIAD